jgi:hypothetical protein
VPVVVPGPSSLHWNVDVSLAVNVNEGEALLVRPLGPLVIVAVGGVASTVKLRVVATPVFPAPSVARTENV